MVSKSFSVLQDERPEFDGAANLLNAADYKLPQCRSRVFIVGVLKQCCPPDVRVPAIAGLPETRVPEPLQPFGTALLKDFLGKADNLARTSLTVAQQNNLKAYESKLKTLVQQGIIQDGQLAVIAVDRAEGKTYRQQIRVDVLPTLTCHNRYLMVLSMDFAKPDHKRDFARFCCQVSDCLHKAFRQISHRISDLLLCR